MAIKLSMKLGFYYHIPVYLKGDQLLIASYLGVFIQHLAQNVEELVLFLYHESIFNEQEYDIDIAAPNVRFVDMGQKPPAWKRMLFQKCYLNAIKQELNAIDTLLVRAPSPLAPYFPDFLPPHKLAYLLVGSYRAGAQEMEAKNWRDRIIQQFLILNQKQLEKATHKARVLVNSKALFDDYQRLGVQPKLIKTTTITRADLYERTDTCSSSKVHLLYTGRIDLAKGLVELVRAMVNLLQKGLDLQLHIVGWEPQGQTTVTNRLKAVVRENGFEKHLTFHGKKKVGPELNWYYQHADIYLMPSHHEGFPRTIWEAMANSMPVIATTVGSIPHYLAQEKNALLIPPKSEQAIADAIQRIVHDDSLRQRLIKEGHALAHDCLLENQTRRVIEILEG